MICPGCGLYHPQQFEHCVSCGQKLVASAPGGNLMQSSSRPHARSNEDAVHAHNNDEKKEQLTASSNSSAASTPTEAVGSWQYHKDDSGNFGSAGPPWRRPKANANKPESKTALPGAAVALRIFAVLAVLTGSAAATVFFLTRTPSDQGLVEEAQKELANGQYAFAVKTLNKARAVKPNDSRLYLLLARAYVGIDQIDRAWDAIGQAQQLGAALVSEPELATQLANYYRQNGQFEKAIDLLRPLAKAEMPGKRAELADLDAMWGDDALRSGHPDLALRCWEEVRDLKEGSRYSEVDSRLATIYTKLSDIAIAKQDDDKALAFLAKLNLIAQNPKNYQLAASIYERTDKLDQAIDQIRQGLKVAPHEKDLEKKLVELLNRRGKELLDKGDGESGFAYLQQAKQIDSTSTVPLVALKNLAVRIDNSNHYPRLVGQIWNPGLTAVNALSIKVELWDETKSEILWSKENQMIDEFVAPLGPKESRSFEFVSDVPSNANDETAFHIYLDGNLYKSYPVGGKAAPAQKQETDQDTTGSAAPTPGSAAGETSVNQAASTTIDHQENSTTDNQASPLPGKSAIPKKAPSAEEKTMKDLEF
jgi:tetratricopeptide (TPR) repeat protein